MRPFFHFNRKSEKTQKGTILTFFALTLIPLIGITALAIDLGIAYLVRKEMQSAADLAGLAGVKRLSEPSPTASLVREAVRLTAEENQVRFNRTNVSHYTSVSGICGGGGVRVIEDAAKVQNSDIIFGRYDFSSKAFTSISTFDLSTINSVKVTLRMGEGLNAPLSWRFAQVMGFTDQEFWVISSTAALGPRLIAVVADVSGSMDDRSHPPYPPDDGISACDPNAAPPGPADANVLINCPTVDLTEYFVCASRRNFRYGPRTSQDLTNCLSWPGQYGGTGMPQPIYDVFTLIRNDLLTNQLFQLSGYQAYFSTYSSPPAVMQIDFSESNAATIQNFITDQSLNYWTNYAQLADPDQYNASDPRPFPRGFTGTGDAMNRALARINQVAATLGSLASGSIVVLSDGISNCSPSQGCGNTPDQIKAARNYDIRIAKTAAKSDVVIHTIYFNTQAASLCESDPAFLHLRKVAQTSSSTEGSASCADNITELRTALQKINQKPPYVVAV